jgi:4-hydroxybenzoyl-CoA thioesterase
VTPQDGKGGPIVARRTIAFGDCDPAGIAYTPRLVAICLEAIDEAWKVILDGEGWFELTADHGRGSPFVSIAMEFTAPVTPRTPLDLEVRLSRVGQTSLTFEVAAIQDGGECYK